MDKFKLISKAKGLKAKAIATEMEVNLLSVEIELSESNLSRALRLEEDLTENIALHKSSETIPVLMEYKKSKEDLVTVRKNIFDLKNKINLLSKKYERLIKSSENYQNEYDDILNYLKDDNIILVLKKREKNEVQRED